MKIYMPHLQKLITPTSVILIKDISSNQDYDNEGLHTGTENGFTGMWSYVSSTRHANYAHCTAGPRPPS